MKEFNLGDLFRYSIPGAVFPITLNATCPEILPLTSKGCTVLDAAMVQKTESTPQKAARVLSDNENVGKT